MWCQLTQFLHSRSFWDIYLEAFSDDTWHCTVKIVDLLYRVTDQQWDVKQVEAMDD